MPDGSILYDHFGSSTKYTGTKTDSWQNFRNIIRDYNREVITDTLNAKGLTWWQETNKNGELEIVVEY